jgi:CheY-like chemotaxis protein
VNKKRILFVDDSEDFRELFKEGLEKRGFEVVTAANVNDALRLITNEQFDVLVSDLHMPDAGDGFTVVSAMRHANPKAVTVVPNHEYCRSASLTRCRAIFRLWISIQF